MGVRPVGTAVGASAGVRTLGTGMGVRPLGAVGLGAGAGSSLGDRLGHGVGEATGCRAVPGTGVALADGTGDPLPAAAPAAVRCRCCPELTAAPAVHPPHSRASPATTPAARTVAARGRFEQKSMHSSWVSRIA